MKFENSFLGVLKEIRDKISVTGGSIGNITLNLEGIETVKGTNGLNGLDGSNGLSAYEIWLELGNIGTEQDFIDSLKDINDNYILINIDSEINPALAGFEAYQLEDYSIGTKVCIRKKYDLAKCITIFGAGINEPGNYQKDEMRGGNLFLYSKNDYIILEKVSDNYFEVLDYYCEGILGTGFFTIDKRRSFFEGKAWNLPVTFVKNVGGLKVYKLTNDYDFIVIAGLQSYYYFQSAMVYFSNFNDYAEFFQLSTIGTDNFNVYIYTTNDLTDVTFNFKVFGRI